MEAAEARLSLHLSKCLIVGNHMHWLIYSLCFLGDHLSDFNGILCMLCVQISPSVGYCRETQEHLL